MGKNDGNNLIWIAGPCVIESETMIFHLAEKLKSIAEHNSVDYYFKASFDKANRTSINSFRGPGIEKGLQILEKVKHEIGVRICTDIHEPWQAESVAEIADVIQIPAFLCRQTDLVVAAAKTGKIINVKKGQFLAPWDMINVVQKVKESGNEKVWICERGTSFGYNNLVVDMNSIMEMKKMGCPIIFDGTHSVQKPGGNGTSTGGNREYVPGLCYAASAVGADGLFMETHENPNSALSDGPNMIPVDKVEDVVKKCIKIRECIKNE